MLLIAGCGSDEPVTPVDTVSVHPVSASIAPDLDNAIRSVTPDKNLNNESAGSPTTVAPTTGAQAIASATDKKQFDPKDLMAAARESSEDNTEGAFNSTGHVVIPDDMDFFQKPEAPSEPVNEPPPEEVEKLSIRLLGFAQPDPSNPEIRLAILKDETKLYLVAEGERVNKAKVVSIKERTVTLEHRGTVWSIDLLSQPIVNGPQQNAQPRWGAPSASRQRQDGPRLNRVDAPMSMPPELKFELPEIPEVIPVPEPIEPNMPTLETPPLDFP